MEDRKPNRLRAFPHPEVSQSFLPSSSAPAWTQGIPMVTSWVDSSTFGRAQHAKMPLHSSAVPRMSRTTSRSTASALLTPRSLTSFDAPRARGSNVPGIAANERGAHGWDHLHPTMTGGRPRRLSFASHEMRPQRQQVRMYATKEKAALAREAAQAAALRPTPASAPLPSVRTGTLRARLLQMREDARPAHSEPATVDGLTVQTNAALPDAMPSKGEPLSVEARLAALEATIKGLDAENTALRQHVDERDATIERLLDDGSEAPASDSSDAGGVESCSECSADDSYEHVDTSTPHSAAVSRVISLMPDEPLTLHEKGLTLSSDDLKALLTTAKLGVLRPWLLALPSRLGQKHPLLQLNITVDNREWRVMLRDGALTFSSADVHFANRMLSRNISNALVKDSSAVRSIRRHMDSVPTLYSDGRALYAYLWQRVENKSGVSTRLTEKAFSAKAYLELKMDSDDVEEAIEQIASDLQELPAEYSARHTHTNQPLYLPAYLCVCRSYQPLSPSLSLSSIMTHGERKVVTLQNRHVRARGMGVRTLRNTM